MAYYNRDRFSETINNRSENNLVNKIIGGVVAGITSLVLLGTGVAAYRPVGAQQLGVVQRLGQYERIATPGPNWINPWIESMTKVDTNTVHKVEIGFRTVQQSRNGETAEYKDALNDSEMRHEAQMLTADQNIIWGSMVMHYKVDPSRVTEYVYNVKNPEHTIQQVGQAAYRQTVGNFGVDEILTFARSEIEDTIQDQAQELLDSYMVGIKVVDVQLQQTQPPAEVSEAFNDVANAVQNKQQKKDEAIGYRNRVTKEAEGEAKQIIADAQAQRATRIGQAESDVAEFELIYDQYKIDPEGTKRRLYIETMESVLRNTDKVIIDDDLDGLFTLLDAEGGN